MNAIHDEVAGLLGVYALHALDADEARFVEVHLASCAECRAELDEHHEVAASLALAADVESTPLPEGTLAAIRQRIGEEGLAVSAPPATVHVLDAARPLTRRRSRLRRIGMAAAAAAAGVAVTVPIVANRGEVSIAALAKRTESRSGSRVVVLRDAKGSALARVVIGRDGEGFLTNEHLEPLADGRTYQLWAVTDPNPGAKPISAGLLGRSPTAIAFTVTADVSAYAISVEPTSGSVEATTVPIAAGAVA